MSDLTNDLASSLKGVMLQVRRQESIESYCAATLRCMEQEKVGLDGALAKVRQYVNDSADRDKLTPAHRAMVAEVMDAAEAEIRETVDYARQVIAWADQT